MNGQSEFFLSLLVLLSGLGFSGASGKFIDQSQFPEAWAWPIEGEKDGQIAIRGRVPASGFGGSLAKGDVNADGFDDLIVGARYVSEIIPAGGEVYVVPGPLAFGKTYAIVKEAALTFQGVTGDQPQIGVYAESGDMNGDGYDEIVFGSWTLGQVYVYAGSPEIQVSQPQTVPVFPEQFILTVTGAGDGIVLCDLNRDGYNDLFVEGYSFEAGVQAWGILGSADLAEAQPRTIILPEDADITIHGVTVNEWVSPIQKNMACGDIDGDSYPDLAIGFYGASPKYRSGAGIVSIVRGDPGFTHDQPVTVDLPEQAGATIEGTDGRIGESGDQLGYSMAIAEVNQDERADLIISAPGASGPGNLKQYAGEVYLWTGRALEGQRFEITSQASWVVHGGDSLATGDFDNDGTSEILLGCPSCEVQNPSISGRSYVLEPNQISGIVAVSVVAQFEVLPATDENNLGLFVLGVDMDGDGFEDLALSDPSPGYPEGNLPGSVYLISYPIRYKDYFPMIYK